MTDEELEKLATKFDNDTGFVRRIRRMEDFRYDERQEKYWDTTTGILLGPKSVDGAIPRKLWPTRPGKSGDEIPYAPSIAINNVDSGLTVEGSTWWPGKPQFIENMVATGRGVVAKPGAVTYNSYLGPQRPEIRNPDPELWVEHIKLIYPDPVEHEHFFNFAAHVLQRPDEKMNHAIVLAGSQGIGKDTALLPLRRGAGEWNVAEINPEAVFDQYNGYVCSVLLVINEVRPYDDHHRASNFYNTLKPLLSSPPEMLPVNAKYANTIYVRNLCHVVMTTNDPMTMYVPESDRRLFIMNSHARPSERDAKYFMQLHGWLREGGADHVIAWLMNRDISKFHPSAPPQSTEGKRSIIESAHYSRRNDADDLVDLFMETYQNPPVIFQRDFVDFLARSELFDDADAVAKALAAKNFHYKMADRGYVICRNVTATEWRHKKFRSRVAFVHQQIPTKDRTELVQNELLQRPLSS